MVCLGIVSVYTKNIVELRAAEFKKRYGKILKESRNVVAFLCKICYIEVSDGIRIVIGRQAKPILR